MTEDQNDDQSLSDEQKSAIATLRVQGGHTAGEIASLLGIQESEVKRVLDSLQVFQFEGKLAQGESLMFGPEGPTRSRRKFSTHHLTSAAHNARLAGILEEITEDRDNEDIVNGVEVGRLRAIHDSHVISSYISSFSGIEVTINEFLHEIDRGSPDIKQNMIEDIQNLLVTFPGDFLRDMRTEAKYQLVLEYANSDPFDPGEEPWQSLRIVRELRNYFVHHKPEVVELPEEDDPDARLGSMLKTKDFELNPEWENEDAPYFPHKCLSYGCSKWVFETSIEIIDSFYERIDGQPPYQPFKDKLQREIEKDWSGGMR